MRARLAATGVALGLAVTLSACGSTDDTPPAVATPESSSSGGGEVVVPARTEASDRDYCDAFRRAHARVLKDMATDDHEVWAALITADTDQAYGQRMDYVLANEAEYEQLVTSQQFIRDARNLDPITLDDGTEIPGETVFVLHVGLTAGTCIELAEAGSWEGWQ